MESGKKHKDAAGGVRVCVSTAPSAPKKNKKQKTTKKKCTTRTRTETHARVAVKMEWAVAVFVLSVRVCGVASFEERSFFPLRDGVGAAVFVLRGVRV